MALKDLTGDTDTVGSDKYGAPIGTAAGLNQRYRSHSANHRFGGADSSRRCLGTARHVHIWENPRQWDLCGPCDSECEPVNRILRRAFASSLCPLKSLSSGGFVLPQGVAARTDSDSYAVPHFEIARLQPIVKIRGVQRRASARVERAKSSSSIRTQPSAVVRSWTSIHSFGTTFPLTCRIFVGTHSALYAPSPEKFGSVNARRWFCSCSRRHRTRRSQDTRV
jgi:hypothetical protein